MRMNNTVVIPAEAGIQIHRLDTLLDSGLRRNDE